MVAGRVKSVMGLQRNPPNAAVKPKPVSAPKPSPKPSGASIPRSLGSYFPRASAQVQPRPPGASELVRLVEELRESESRLKTELLEQKLLRESAAIVPVLENAISSRDSEIELSRNKVECLEEENQRLRRENELLHMELHRQNQVYEDRIKQMQAELLDIKRIAEERDASSSTSSSASSNKSGVPTRCLRKCVTQNINTVAAFLDNVAIADMRNEREIKKDEDSPDGLLGLRSRGPRVPTPPPPRPSASLLSPSPKHLSSSASSPAYGSLSDSAFRAFAAISSFPPPPPPPPPVKPAAPPPPHSKSSAPPAPPPPPPRKGFKPVPAKVRRAPEVVEFYHSLMRRDFNFRRDPVSGADQQAAGAAAKDMIGEIENRSAHLLAIKTDVETQGDFIRFLIKEVEGAAFTDIEDVVPFVKWLDDELSYLVDERAVLKHFNWPEKKADALREAAFGYCDLKKLESEVSAFRDDHRRQPCGHALKKIQSLFEKLEHGVYNLSRMRESSAERYKSFQIPVNWMLDTGYVSQIKVASVTLAMKYMKRVSAELEMVSGGSEEEELILQGVKFAFRVHQFAGGFDVETMRAFQELRDKARVA